VVDGPYKFIRHPYYLSVIAELSGMAIFLNAFISLFFILVIQGSLLRLRIINEEKELVGRFGEKYLAYKLMIGSMFPKRRSP
jgi:protein-S-isoprenylcysteine O-methyltransferase Ste14